MAYYRNLSSSDISQMRNRCASSSYPVWSIASSSQSQAVSSATGSQKVIGIIASNIKKGPSVLGSPVSTANQSNFFSQTIKEKLDSMPIEEYELLLKGCTDKSKTTSSEHKEIINQLEYQMKTQPEEAITSLTNSKHSSSLQSLDQKEKVKKVPCGTVNLNQQQKNQNLTNNSSSGTNNLPAQYYFNCIQDIGQPYSNLNQETVRGTDRENNSESHSAENASLFPDLNDERTAFRNKSNIQLSGNCKAVLSVTDPNLGGIPTGSSNDRTLVNESSLGLKSYTPITSSLKSATSNCPTVTHFTPYHSNIISPGSPPPQVTIRGSSESSRRLDDAAAATHGRKKGKTKDKDNKRESSFTVPLDKEFDLNEAIKFVEGESLEGKRGNKNKKKGVKSMSLDDDNLSIAAKKTEKDRGDRSSSVKNTTSSTGAPAATTTTTTTIITTANINSNPISAVSNNNNNQSSTSSPASLLDQERGKDNNNKEKKGKEVVVIESESSLSLPPPPSVVAGSSQRGGIIKKSSGQISNTRERRDGEDSRSPVPSKAEEFKLVIRKRKNKTVSTSSSSGNPGGKEEEKQDVDGGRKGRSRGERRKSVGSVPGSDQSEGSDDGSVRSLPAGQCTKRENVPKSCASSGGTPQTSYADIARLTKDEDVKKEVPQAPEDYPSLHGFENSEGSDDGSDRSAPPPPPVPVADETVAAKEIIVPAVSGKQAANVNNTPQTSWAYIARLHSSPHEEKKEDNSNNRKDQQSGDDFPELNTTVSAVSHDSSAELLPSPKSDLSASMNSSSKHASSDSAFPQLIASKQSNSLPQGSSNTKTMSSVLPNSTVTPKVANAVPAAAGTPSNASTNNASQGPTSTQKAQQTFSASPTVTHPPSTVTSQAKNSVNTTAGAGANIVTNVNVANSRVLRSPPTVSVNCTHVSDGTNPSKTNVHVSNNSSSALSNAQKDLPASYVNGHLSESERERVMKRSDIPGAKMDKSSFSINQPPPLNVDSGMSQCTEAVVFCGENFKEPPQLPSKDLQFEFGFNVSEVLVDMNKKVSPDVVVPAKNISVKHTKAKNAPSPPPKDGVQASRGNHGPPPSNKQQGYAPRPQREDARSRDFEKNGSRFQNNRNEHNQGPRRMPAASANNEGDDTSKPASANLSDAQVVVSANKPVSSGIPSERPQSFKATQAKLGHNPKKPFQTGQPGESAPSATPSEMYSKSAILTQYPVTTPTMPVHPGGHGVPPVYGMPSFVTSAPPPNYPNRLPTTAGAVPLPVTGPMVPVVLPTPYDATQPPPQYVQQVYSVRTASAPVANATTGEDDYSTTTGNNAQQPPQTGGPAPNTEYITTVSAAGGTGGPGTRQAHSTTTHGQHQHHHQRGLNQVPAHNYRANVVDVTCSVPTSEPPPPKEVSSATIVTGSLSYPINFAPHYVSPDPARYSSVNVDDLRNYLGRRQQECQRLKGSVREIT